MNFSVTDQGTTAGKYSLLPEKRVGRAGLCLHDRRVKIYEARMITASGT
jgi:hypothetical protein